MARAQPRALPVMASSGKPTPLNANAGADSNPVPDNAVRSERVLDDVQFSLWPADAVRAVLPAGWELHEAGDVRELRRDGRAWLVRERTSATTLQVRNRADGYDLTIESVAGGAPSP